RRGRRDLDAQVGPTREIGARGEKDRKVGKAQRERSRLELELVDTRVGAHAEGCLVGEGCRNLHAGAQRTVGHGRRVLFGPGRAIETAGQREPHVGARGETMIPPQVDTVERDPSTSLGLLDFGRAVEVIEGAEREDAQGVVRTYRLAYFRLVVPVL